MRLVRSGSWCPLVEIRDRNAILRVLDPRFSYKVEGAIFSEAYRTHRWDGKVHLVRKVRGGTLSLPSGIVDEALELLDRAGYAVEVEDRRPATPPAIPAVEWRGPALRNYQGTAITLALADARGGILKLPTRSGKTMIAAGAIAVARRRTLFVVTSDLLLRQARGVFESVLGGVSVTGIGGGEWDDSGDVVVASIQTLATRYGTRQFSKFAASFGLAFFDEVHHLSGPGEAWRDVALTIDAPIKIGLSATVDLSGEEIDEGAIWLRAVCGPIRYEVGLSDLIDAGYLVRPLFRFVRHGAPDLPDSKWTQGTYAKAITNCEPRNDRLAAEAVRYAREGYGVLVDVGRIPHVRILADLVSRGLPPGQVVALTGETPAEVRDTAIAAFRRREIRVIVGTILGEGVDIPEIDVVVNAEGGRAKVSTLQRLRNLTPAPGKKIAIVIEPIDLHHPSLREWTRERIAIYRRQKAFRFEIEPRG